MLSLLCCNTYGTYCTWQKFHHWFDLVSPCLAELVEESLLESSGRWSISHSCGKHNNLVHHQLLLEVEAHRLVILVMALAAHSRQIGGQEGNFIKVL